MIKKVKLINKITDKFELPVDVFKIEPPLKSEDNNIEAEYLIGGFYKTIGYSMAAFYASDKNGNILDDRPIIKEEGINTYFEIFQNLGYTFI